MKTGAVTISINIFVFLTIVCVKYILICVAELDLHMYNFKPGIVN